MTVLWNCTGTTRETGCGRLTPDSAMGAARGRVAHRFAMPESAGRRSGAAVLATSSSSGCPPAKVINLRFPRCWDSPNIPQPGQFFADSSRVRGVQDIDDQTLNIGRKILGLRAKPRSEFDQMIPWRFLMGFRCVGSIIVNVDQLPASRVQQPDRYSGMKENGLRAIFRRAPQSPPGRQLPVSVSNCLVLGGHSNIGC